MAIPALEAAPLPVVTAHPPPAAIVPAPLLVPIAPQGPAVARLPEREDHRALIYGGFGVGAVGVLVGAIAGGITLARASTIRDACGDHFCEAGQTDALSSTTTLANVSNVSFVVGALGAGAGVVGLLLSQPHAAAPKAALAVTPTLGPGIIGLRGSF